MKKVFIFNLVQESNSFNPLPTTYQDFADYVIREGEEFIDHPGVGGATVDGMAKCVREFGNLPVGGICMSSKSGGPVEDSVILDFVEKTLSAIEEIKPDAVLASLHGATVTPSCDDVCGMILERIRNAVGKDIVVSASFDMHANITEKIAKNADYICGYLTYPHLDQFEVGYRAAKLAMEHLEGKKRFTAWTALPQMAPPHAYTTDSGNLQKLIQRAEALAVDCSVFQVQPWMDIPVIGSAVTAVADTPEEAISAAEALAKEAFVLRKELQGTPLFSIGEVIAKAQKNKTGKPVVLVDSADSVNAGACGDSAAVAAALLPYRDSLSAVVPINDTPCVEQAFRLGVGGKGDFTVGATLAPKLYEPVFLPQGEVVGLYEDGRFRLYGPAEKDEIRNNGRTAVLRFGKLLIQVSEFGQNHGDLNFYRSFGVEPAKLDLVCVKACTSFRAGYLPIAAEICNTETPGAAGTNLRALPFERLPKPFYPFEETTEEQIPTPKIFR